MNYKYMLFLVILLTGCQQKREVSTSFYFWKTVYQTNALEQDYLQHFKSSKLFVRILDVDRNLDGAVKPVAPIKFKEKIPKDLELVPVVYIVNDVLRTADDLEIKILAKNIVKFIDGKMKQAGKSSYTELQIDCDWTATTRLTYFSLLQEIKVLVAKKKVSSTLRLHQLKNQEKSGIPPVEKVLLMCYNMGNLRKYGPQNSILSVNELKKYVGRNLGFYPVAVDIALPLFSWSVIFRNEQYVGISKRITLNDLESKANFSLQIDGLYLAKTDLPAFGVVKNDRVRYEESNSEDLKNAAQHLSKFLSEKPLNLIYYHLDQNLIKNYEVKQLEEIANILR